MIEDLVRCSQEVLWLFELRVSKLAIHPACASLDQRVLRVKTSENVILHNRIDQFLHLWLCIPDAFLMHITKSIEKCFSRQILAGNLLQILHDGLDVVLQVHGLKLILFLAKFEGANLLHKH